MKTIHLQCLLAVSSANNTIKYDCKGSSHTTSVAVSACNNTTNTTDPYRCIHIITLYLSVITPSNITLPVAKWTASSSKNTIKTTQLSM